jgi:RNA polymerase sigma-70 factor (ECF subfamily)
VGILDADDVASELQMKALKAALAFDPSRGFKFTTYLWPLIWGKTVDLRRRYGRRDRSGHTRPMEVPILEEALGLAESAPGGLNLSAMIDQLPLRERAAFLLREIGGVSAGEIGEALGLSDGRTKALRRQAVRRLRVAAERPR